jgi:hypothetical protein
MPAKKTITDAQGRAPKKGDKVVAHYLAGDKPRVQMVPATVAGLRDDGTLDLAASLMGRPVTLEAMGPCPGGRYGVGWTIPEAAAAPASEPPGAPQGGGSTPNPANPGPLKPNG